MPLKFKIFRLLPHVVLMKTCNHYRSTFVIFIIMYCVIIFLLLSSFIIKFVIVVVLHAIFSWAYSLAICTISRQYVLDARVMSQIIIRFQFCFCFIFVRTHTHTYTHGINFGFWWYKIRTMIPLACKWVCVCVCAACMFIKTFGTHKKLRTKIYNFFSFSYFHSNTDHVKYVLGFFVFSYFDRL